MATKNGTQAGTQAKEAPKQRPAQSIRFGRLKATIWRQDSDKGAWYSVVLSRAYKDQAGNWQSSGSFGRDELLLLAKLADQAHSWICRQLSKDAASSGNGEHEEEGAGQEEEIPY